MGLGWVGLGRRRRREGEEGGEIVKELRYEFSDNSIAPYTRLLHSSLFSSLEDSRRRIEFRQFVRAVFQI